MSETKHIPEPWSQSDTWVFAADREFIAVAFGHKQFTNGRANANANAERIVACVNALAGIDDPEAFVKEAKAAMQKDKFPFL
jgi:hypothetical protein